VTYLLDTNVLSEVRKPHAHPAVASWFKAVPVGDLFLSALVLGEIRNGVERLRPRDARQAAVFERWLDGLKQDFEDRVLPVTTIVAEAWGRIGAPHPLAPIDGLLTATALVHGLTFVTREAQRLERTGISLLDPWRES
jgi:predicted nucleic acid-binding protein